MKSLLVVVVALIMSWSGSALGATFDGWVTGTLKFKQIQGNFCDTAAGQDCTSAKYLDTEYNTNQPIRDAKVLIVNDDTGSAIGSGTSGIAGNFGIQWSVDAAAPPSTITVRVKYEHKDNRFSIRSYSSGSIYYTAMRTIVPDPGSTQSTPQSIGSRVTSTSIASLYDGAYRTWADAMFMSTQMANLFTGVKVRAYDADCDVAGDPDCECPTACANGSTKTVIIPTSDDTRTPLHRIMHELGHIGNYLSKPYVSPGKNIYAFPAQACLNCDLDWQMAGSEWGAAQFEEAMATMHSMVALYGSLSPEPMQCRSTLGCYSLGSNNDVELSGPVAGSCPGSTPLSALRFFWDVYDNHVEPTITDNLHLSYGTFTATMASYPDGVGDHQIDEPWSVGFGSVTDLEGRGPQDFYYNLLVFKGQPVSPAPALYSNVFTGNCSPQ